MKLKLQHYEKTVELEIPEDSDAYTVLDSFLDCMVGISFLQTTVYEALLDKASEIQDYLDYVKTKNTFNNN